MKYRPLHVGSRGPGVFRLKQRLFACGYGLGDRMDDRFTAITKAAVEQYQAGHLDVAGKPLVVDGVVGRDTQWALDHPYRHWTDKGLLDAIAAFGLGALPEPIPSVLRKALSAVGDQEYPKGSNGGPEVDVYTGGLHEPWCAHFVSWAIREGTGEARAFPPLRTGRSALKIREWARAHGAWIPEGPKAEPRPGDVFVILRPGSRGVDVGRGHVGLVFAAGAETIRSVEGNVDDGVGVRERARSTMTGYARRWP